MNHSSSTRASIHVTCEAIIMAKPVEKMFVQPTTKSTDLLEQQLAQAAGAVPTSQWGGTSGCLALVLKQEPFKDTTGLNDKVNRQVKPALVHKDLWLLFFLLYVISLGWYGSKNITQQVFIIP